MPLVLEANYSKKIGLPGFSSHQFSVTLSTEITDLSTVQAESDRLYSLLQNAVDTSLQQVGYLPEAAPKNGHSNGNGHRNNHSNGNNDGWQCSPKQRDLVLKITEEHKLEKVAVDELAVERFGKGVRQLNKLEASGLIDELLEQTGQKNGNHQRRFNGRSTLARAA